MFRAGFFVAMMALVAGCGFQPLYAERPSTDGAAVALRQISVPPIPERLGQLLRIELITRLTPNGQPQAPAYVLDVSLSESKQDLAVRKDATATRANLIIAATFDLKSVETKETLISGTVRSINSYNILDADFATLSAESDARQRAVRDLATEIRSRLGIFLSRPADA